MTSTASTPSGTAQSSKPPQRSCAPSPLAAACCSRRRGICSSPPGPPSVITRMVISSPAAAWRSSAPPHPSSTSSGCAPTASTRRLVIPADSPVQTARCGQAPGIDRSPWSLDAQSSPATNDRSRRYASARKAAAAVEGGTMRMHRISVAALATVSALVLTVVGATGAGAGLTKKQACDLVDESDVEAAFGAAPSDTVSDGKKGQFTTCTWRVPDANGATGTVFVGIDKVSKPATKDFAKRSKSPTAEKVKGIKKGFHDGQTVTFITNGNFVNVQYVGATPADTAANEDAIVGFAKTVYDAL